MANLIFSVILIFIVIRALQNIYKEFVSALKKFKGENNLKIKKDYITNSSSTSFTAWGVEFDNRFSDESIKKIYEYAKTKNLCYDLSLDEYKKSNCYEDFFYSKIIDDFHLLTGNLESGFVIGLDPRDMKDDETLLEFKERIIEIFELFSLDVQIEDVKYFNTVVTC